MNAWNRDTAGDETASLLERWGTFGLGYYGGSLREAGGGRTLLEGKQTLLLRQGRADALESLERNLGVGVIGIRQPDPIGSQSSYGIWCC